MVVLPVPVTQSGEHLVTQNPAPLSMLIADGSDGQNGFAIQLVVMELMLVLGPKTRLRTMGRRVLEIILKNVPVSKNLAQLIVFGALGANSLSAQLFVVVESKSETEPLLWKLVGLGTPVLVQILPDKHATFGLVIPMEGVGRHIVFHPRPVSITQRDKKFALILQLILFIGYWLSK